MEGIACNIGEWALTQFSCSSSMPQRHQGVVHRKTEPEVFEGSGQLVQILAPRNVHVTFLGATLSASHTALA